MRPDACSDSGSRRPRSQELSELLGASWLALPLWQQVQPLALAAPTRQDLGTYLDRVTAPQQLVLSGPMAQGHLMTIEIRDVGLILLKPVKMSMQGVPSYYGSHEQYHTGVTNWTNNLWEESNKPTCNKPVRIHCKTGSLSVRLVFETRAKCQDFVARYKDDGIPSKLIVHFATAEPISQSASPSQLKTEKSGIVLRPCGEFWPKSSRFCSLMEMTQVPSLSLLSTSVRRSEGSSKRRGENQCSNLLLWETDRCLPLLLLICMFLVFLPTCCNRPSLKPARSMCDGRRFASPPLRRLAGRGPFSAVSHGLYTLRSL